MHTSSSSGILAGHRPLGRALHVAFVVMVVASAVRYLQGHGLGDQAWVVLPGAVLLLAVHAAGRSLSGGLTIAWLALLVLTWVGLVWLAPSFAWAAVPLAFHALRLLSFRLAVLLVAGLVVTVAGAWSRMTDRLDPTTWLGPACVAALVVTAYRALERDAATRGALLDELEAAQDDVADAERRAGVVAERARLSRDIHDSVAQGLTSITLLLRAAEQDWDVRPDAARRHTGEAALMAHTSLDDVRRVVRDLAPSELAAAGGSALVAAVRQVAAEVAAATGLDVEVHVHGTPHHVTGRVSTAVVRTLRGALSNVAEHARARTAAVSLTFHDRAVALDVRDDGVGFDPAHLDGARARELRGHGLSGMRDRARALGGDLVVESTPGEGTVVAATFDGGGGEGGA